MSITEIVLRLHANSYYFFAILLFIIGFHTMLTHNNLIKKVIGMNIMDMAIFLFFVAIGYVRGGRSPILEPGVNHAFINPLPSALILTGIVVAVSVTAYALSLIIKLYKHYGTIDAEEIMRIRGGGSL
ncbi:MAG: cation:proton antiporter subunit C [Dethiobacter sp.]|jgi:multicomponent Na+:H+ antiporter subunit C|nr:cation:proton antiporter subunit C [Dethiobacter sp.]MBS3901168.1 cation:proton antiporter subunit C [Dethiobacter sp.]MBS3989140.1 cation:proton antiporter subunit C [Dethiobacter sp.]